MCRHNEVLVLVEMQASSGIISRHKLQWSTPGSKARQGSKEQVESWPVAPSYR